MGGQRPHDVTLRDDAVDVLSVIGDDERADATIAQLGHGVGQRRLLADRGDVGSLRLEDRLDVHAFPGHAGRDWPLARWRSLARFEGGRFIRSGR